MSVNSARFLSDLILVASNKSTPDNQNKPAGYELVGYWDVDKGGATGAKNSTGNNVMAMYALYKPSSSLSELRLGQLMLTCSDQSTPVAPIGPTDQPGSWIAVGNWDVDKGGGVGTNGSRGSYIAGLYKLNTTGIQLNAFFISEILLTASNQDFPVMPSGSETDYQLMGYWDVDSGGSTGTGGTTTGTNKMGLFIRYSQYTG